MDGRKRPQMLQTPEESCDGSATAMSVNISIGRRVFRTDQNVLASKAPSEAAQGQEYC